jgi:hypothetical protein
LFSYLTQHPDVCGSDVKELRYFTSVQAGGELGPVEDYTAHFSHCAGQRFALEATPGYFYGGRTLVRRMGDTLPDARIILSLRAPGERCWSWFRFVKTRLHIPKDMSFDEYLDRCEELHRAGVVSAQENYAYWGMIGGCYDLHMDAWLAEFGDRIHVVSFEDLGRDPERTVRSICRWLDLDESVVDRFQFGVENRTLQYRVEGLQRLAMQVSRRSEPFLRRHGRLKRWLRSAYYAVNRQAPDDSLTPDARARLVEFFRPHNARLAAQLSSAGHPLPTWLAGTEEKRA